VFPLLRVTISSLLICFFLTPFLRDFFGFLGIVDRPDSARKLHARPIPRVGGVGLAISYFVALMALLLGWWSGRFNLQDPTVLLMAKLLPAVVLIFVVGLVDDIRGLSPWRKLAGQIVAATYAVWVGVRLASPPNFAGSVILIDVVSIFWLVLCANAFNLIDGLDGLATGVAIIASASLLMAAMLHHHPGLAIIITPFLGALFGFLYYNFNPASIFLGDCGSLLVGFLLGCYGLLWNQHATTGLGRIAPVIALAFPMFEVALSVSRRFLRSQPVFGSDRNHIHHRIQTLGLSQRKSTLVLYGVSVLAAVLAVLQTLLRPQLWTVLALLCLSVAYVGFRSLRYAEFGILGRFLFAGGLRHALRARINLHEYEASLAAAHTIEECWTVLRNACRDASFSYVSLNVGTERFEAHLRTSSSSPGRVYTIALVGEDSATFIYDEGVAGPDMLLVPLAERLREKLSTSEVLSWVGSGPPRLKTREAAAG
jgi:UDP-GlcNAc:undecaprenyl-phosphate/decaprenyl-phosphate GlcNAc-1-phosphate transferase